MLCSIRLETALSMPGHTRKAMNIRAGSASFAPGEVAALLHWACPETEFPSSLGRHSRRDRASGQTVLPTKQRQVVGTSNRPAKTSMSSSSSMNNSTFGALDTTSQSAASTSAPDAPQLAALAFASPYALSALSRIYDKGNLLFERRAYIPKYSEVGVEPEDFQNCMTHVADVLMSMD